MMARRAKKPEREQTKAPRTGRASGAVESPIGDPFLTWESPEEGERRAIEDEGNRLLAEPLAKPAPAREAEDEPHDLLPFGPPHEPKGDEPDEPPLDVAQPPARRFPTAGARIRSRMGEGTAVHVATEIPTLDANTRGGLIAARLTIIGGAPDAGKTSIAVQIAHDRARRGDAVAIHCADEDAEGIQFRIGQQIGISLEALEAGDKDALSRLAAYFDGLPALLIVDQDEDRMTVEDTGEALVASAREHAAGGLVLVVDSVQMARARETDAAPNPRERITATTKAMTRFAKTSGALVMATCELARAAYRSRNSKDRIEDMAAFKESGAVEYAMNTGLVLRPVPGTEDEIDVSIPKNKRGKRAPFRLRRDPARCAYVEIPLPPDEDEDAGKRKRLEAAIVAYVRQNPGCGVTSVRTALGGNAAQIGEAIERLVLQGVLLREKNARGVALRVAPSEAIDGANGGSGAGAPVLGSDPHGAERQNGS